MSIAKIKSYVRWRPNKRLLVALLLVGVVVLGGVVYFVVSRKDTAQVSSPDCAALINTARPPTYAKPADLYNELKTAQSYCLNTSTKPEGKYQRIQYLVSLAKVAYANEDKQNSYSYAHKASDEYNALSDKEKQGLPDGQTVGITVMTLLEKERTSR